MKKINVFVYNEGVLNYDKEWEMNFSVEGIYEWMSGNEDMIEMLGDGVEMVWSDVKELKSRFGDLYCIKFKDSDVMLRFVDRSLKV